MPQRSKTKNNARSRNSKGHNTARRSESIAVGNISGSTGIAIGRGSRVQVTQSNVAHDEIGQAFRKLQQKLEQSPKNPEIEVAQQALKALESEARKGSKANESSVRKWFSFLASTAPDAWDVAIDTFINPIKGISTAFRKIAERAKAERDEKKD